MGAGLKTAAKGSEGGTACPMRNGMRGLKAQKFPPICAALLLGCGRNQLRIVERTVEEVPRAQSSAAATSAEQQ